MTEQFHMFAAFDEDREARYASRGIAIELVERLKREGYEGFHAPPRPAKFDGAWDEFGDCRVLVKYVPPSSGSGNDDKFVLRVDTLAHKKAKP